MQILWLTVRGKGGSPAVSLWRWDVGVLQACRVIGPPENLHRRIIEHFASGRGGIPFILRYMGTSRGLITPSYVAQRRVSAVKTHSNPGYITVDASTLHHRCILQYACVKPNEPKRKRSKVTTQKNHLIQTKGTIRCKKKNPLSASFASSPST